RLGNYIRGEVAVGALRLAEGQGDVHAEGHRENYATWGISLARAGISGKGLGARAMRAEQARASQASQIHAGKASIL
ncbi:MAG TPA: hypothetical protein VEI99_04475, partial [Terriglobales bacterium]|nr:hypothetical protein [Terriglobales bacterium]